MSCLAQTLCLISRPEGSGMNTARGPGHLWRPCAQKLLATNISAHRPARFVVLLWHVICWHGPCFSLSRRVDAGEGKAVVRTNGTLLPSVHCRERAAACLEGQDAVWPPGPRQEAWGTRSTRAAAVHGPLFLWEPTRAAVVWEGVFVAQAAGRPLAGDAGPTLCRRGLKRYVAEYAILELAALCARMH